jgi:integrase/recombinase XerC
VSAKRTSSSFVELADKFLGMMREERGASEHTLRAYGREVRGFAEFLAETLGEGADVKAVEHTHIRAYMAVLFDRGLTKASVARALAAVRSWFKWLARSGYVEANPALLVSTPKLPKHLPRVPGIEELNRVMNSLGETKTHVSKARRGAPGVLRLHRHPNPTLPLRVEGGAPGFVVAGSLVVRGFIAGGLRRAVR